METRELMIGDWVTGKKWKEKPFQITRINDSGKFIYGKTANSTVGPFFIEELEPIPLTPDILEKNGWVYNNEDEKFFPQTWVGGGLKLKGADDCGYCIVVTSDYDDEDTNDTPFIILYVHELQHALRLRRIKKEIIL